MKALGLAFVAWGMRLLGAAMGRGAILLSLVVLIRGCK